MLHVFNQKGDHFFGKSYFFLRQHIFVAVAIMPAFLNAACVSSTLESSDLQSGNGTKKSAGSETANSNPVQIGTTPATPGQLSEAELAAARAKGVEIIRQKSANPPSAMPQIGVMPTGATTQLSKEQQTALKNELKSQDQTLNNAVTDSELAAKQASIAEMRRRAKQHYSNAVNIIEK